MRFLLIDRITAWEVGRSASAIKNVSLSEDVFADHFPGQPIMPGVLILEGMAQLAGLLLEESARAASGVAIKALLCMVERAKLLAPVLPGDQLEYQVAIVARNEAGGKVDATATCDGKRRAECRLVFFFSRIENQRLEQRQQQLVSLWKRELPG